MSESILFTPVGGHDPIASFHDGAVLHICRKYRPTRVYLYLSQEMLERSRLDDRYRASLRLLQDHLDYPIEEIRQIERDDLTQVQLFDTFYEDFEALLQKIHTEHPESRLLVNLSSGTPAMKSALNIIAALAPYPMQAIQVSTPHERENPKDEDPKAYDVAAFWECNQDNEPGARDRCREVRSSHLLAKIKKESILRFLDAFDYRAAQMLAQDIKEFLPEEGLRLLDAAVCRLELNGSGYTKVLKGLPYNFQPVTEGDHRLVFEYLLQLQVRMLQGSYADFIRGLTPVVLDLFELCLKKQLSLNLRDYCTKDKKGVYRLRLAKLESDEKGREILRALQNGYGDYALREEPYKSADIFYIFQAMSQDAGLVADMEQMREVERKVRNFAAHEIVSVTDDWIFRNVGLRASQIMQLLQRLTVKAGVRVKSQDWNSYQQMNQVIAEVLNRQTN